VTGRSPETVLRPLVTSAALETTAESTLRDYIRVLLRRKWLIIVAVLVAVGVSVALSLVSTKIYAASSQILAESQGTVFTQDGAIVSDPTGVATQVEVIRSRPVAIEVSKRLGERGQLVSAVRVSEVGTTRVISIVAESSDREVARDAATTYAKVYVEQRRTAAVDALQETGRVLLQRAQQAKAQLDDLDAKIAAAKGGDPGLKTQRDAVAAQYTLYQSRYDQSGVDAPLTRGGVQLLQEAALPGGPVRPKPVRNGILALGLGLFVGAGAAFLFEFLDDTVKTSEDVERHSKGANILGVIPAVADWRNRDMARLVTVEDPTAPISEAYRSLRTSLQFIGLRQPLRTLLVTSPMAAEGKTTTLANIAVTLARSGRRVICVDCDLRRPRLHSFFGLSSTTGFTSVLLGDQPLSASLQSVSVSGGGSLRVLASGPLPPNPAELLGTSRVAELLAAVSADADIVLIDAPPLLPITDAVVLSSRVDGVLLVATAQVTSRRHLARAVELLGQAGAETIGIALNGVSSDGEYGYAYNYSYKERGAEGGRRDTEPVSVSDDF
jgi:polysaccharide biosynthesis transport protein